MFEKRKSITVNGVTFDMILVEGDKFRIGDKEVEIDDFYIAEIPVTQELYMAVMGPAHTGSHNMMPDNFDYLDPFIGLKRTSFFTCKSSDEYQKRLERKWIEKSERESKERDRIRKMAAFLPVNNISWLECLDFINKVNSLTGKYFALPSFEQWYFAASGGLESRGYRFAGSDDANEVGHFHKLSKKVSSPGLFVMSGNCDKPKERKAPQCWYEKPKCYKSNELGLYDMSELINEWLDEPGKVIGGSFNSDPERVSRERNYGYTTVTGNGELLDSRGLDSIVAYVGLGSTNPNALFGLRLILTNKPKSYSVPKIPSVKSEVSASERNIINLLRTIPDFGVVRSVVAHKFKRLNVKTGFERIAYGSFQGNIYNVFVCPNNLSYFEGHCFEQFLSRKKFLVHCKEQFKKFINALCNQGYHLLIHDDLGLDLREDPKFKVLSLDLSLYEFKRPVDQRLAKILSKTELFTNNSASIKVTAADSPFYRKCSGHRISHSANLILIEVREEMALNPIEQLLEENLFSNGIFGLKDKPIKLSLNCFCDFRSQTSVRSGSTNSRDSQISGIVRFMINNLPLSNSRVNDVDFDNSEEVNRLFCKRNKGGNYEYHYPQSSGLYLIQDERFYILPLPTFQEWTHLLNDAKK